MCLVGFILPCYYIGIIVSGPTEETHIDFWRMIWEQRTTTIIMLTNLEEKGKVTLNLLSSYVIEQLYTILISTSHNVQYYDSLHTSSLFVLSLLLFCFSLA